MKVLVLCAVVATAALASLAAHSASDTRSLPGGRITGSGLGKLRLDDGKWSLQ